MKTSDTGTKIGIVSTQEMLRVTIPPRRSWLLILVEIGVFVAVALWLYGLRAQMSLLFQALVICGFVSASVALIYQLSVTQAIEFDSQRMTLSKEVRGWVRKEKYRVEDCHELEWSEGSENQPAGLRCKFGWKTIKVCEDLSEHESVEILTALQRSLPDVAQKICSYPKSKEPFVTLGLGRQG